MKTYYGALALDALLVIVFAALGVLSHYGEITLGTLARVAWPFLIALLIAHLAVQAWRVAPHRVWPHGVFIVAITVVGAMVIRTLLGEGTETAFVIVSFAVNTLLLLGWRLIAALRSRSMRTAQ